MRERESDKFFMGTKGILKGKGIFREEKRKFSRSEMISLPKADGEIVSWRWSTSILPHFPLSSPSFPTLFCHCFLSLLLPLFLLLRLPFDSFILPVRSMHFYRWKWRRVSEGGKCERDRERENSTTLFFPLAERGIDSIASFSSQCHSSEETRRTCTVFAPSSFHFLITRVVVWRTVLSPGRT